MHASFSANAAADKAPVDAEAGIVQPVGPIEKCCWIIRKSTGGNNVHRCKLCKREFTGSKIVVATHFDPRASTQQLKFKIKEEMHCFHYSMQQLTY